MLKHNLLTCLMQNEGNFVENYTSFSSAKFHMRIFNMFVASVQSFKLIV